MNFEIKNVSINISQHLKEKFLNIEHKIYVDLNVLVVPILVTDTHLANVAKRTFSQLPLPIRNLVLATGEIENEKVKAQIKVLEEDTRTLIKLLENLVHSTSLCRDSLKESKETLQETAIKAWSDEIEIYRAELEDIYIALQNNFQLEDIPNKKDLYEFCKTLDTKVSEFKCVPSNLQIQNEPIKMDTSIVSARIETSKQYRDHAKKLNSSDFKIQDLINTNTNDELRNAEIDEPIMVGSTSVDTKSKQILEDLQIQIKKIRNKIGQAWLPHRKSIQLELNNLCDAFDKPIMGSIEKFEHFESTKISNEDVFDRTVKNIQKEFEYAIPTFPCDPSALKTCLLVMSEGPKIVLCRKLKEIKQELARSISMYMNQVNTILLEYHELSRPDSKI